MVSDTMPDKLENLGVLEIQKFLRNRYPFLMIDFVEEVIPGKSARGYKNLTVNEWYFQGHFPGNPVMPGALQLEAIFNMSAMALHTIPGNENAMSNIVRINDARFIRNAHPGDCLYIRANIDSYHSGIGKAAAEISVKDTVICRANITLAMVDKLIKPIISEEGE